MAKKKELMSKADFFCKADWEGGLCSLAQYGLPASDIANKKLSKLWADYCDLFGKLEEIGQEIYTLQ